MTTGPIVHEQHRTFPDGLESSHGARPAPLTFHAEKLRADPTRVVVRPFELAWQAQASEPTRAQRLVDDICALSMEDASTELRNILGEFGERHWQIERVFEHRFEQVAANIGLDAQAYRDPHRKLIGAYFCHEYSFAAAALMNPSIVAHPDQSMLSANEVRVIMSMRAVGEGHISSISFREGILESGPNIALWPTSGPALSAENARYAGDIRGGVSVTRNPDATIGNTVIFPVTEAQRNGLEDLRLVRFTHDNGELEWFGTYTAYSGRGIQSELLRTRDFTSFDLIPMSGRAAVNKGMALFPRRIDGSYMMVGRQDGQRLYLLNSDKLEVWDSSGVPLAGPKYAWEFIQIGNCGSPVELDEGWLILTHGVGAMRKYSLGAMLLDRKDPSRVIARSPHPILMASEGDRDGYVPNVVYTCGCLRFGDSLFVPYGFADSGIGFFSVKLRDLLNSLD